MNRKYLVALLAVALVLVVFRVGYSLTQWGDSQDVDSWKLLGDTNKYVVSGHYFPTDTQSQYYGAYSVGFEALLAALTVFTGVDLVTLALYFLQVATPLVMVAVAYLITSRSGRVTNWGIPVMILLAGLFVGITRQQSRMIEENVGFILFCGALLLLYLYYDGRTSRLYALSMLSAILFVTLFTHHISFLMIAILAMPFIVGSLKYAAPAYIAAIFVPWWVYYHTLNGYNGPYVGIYFYTVLALAVLYAIFALCYAVFWRSQSLRSAAVRLLARQRQILKGLSNGNSEYFAALTLLLSAAAVAYSVATRLQSGYVPFFLPLAPLVLYAGAYAVTTNRGESNKIDVTYTRYLFLTLLLLLLVAAVGFVLQASATRAGTLPPQLQSIEALTSVDLGSRFTTWAAFVYGLVATIGLVLVSSGARVTKRWFAPTLIAILLVLASVNVAVLAVNYETSFTITSPPDSHVIAAALWTAGKDQDNATMTDYKSEMVYWYYTGALVTHTPLTEAGNLTVLDYIYPQYLQQWNSSTHVGINYLLLTAVPPKYYHEHLYNGEWTLSSQNVTQWQTRIAAIDSGRSSFDKIYTNGYAHYYKVVGL